MIKIFFINLFCFLSSTISAQHILSATEYNKDSLIKIYGCRKNFIPEYELQSLVALSFYPELINTKISFRLAHKKSIAKTTFTFFSILNSSDKHFIICINNNKSNTGFTLRDAPFNAQVGAIGHELAHVLDFKKKNMLQMAVWGFTYLNKKQQIKIERKTDVVTIQHGLGRQLYGFVDFALNHSTANVGYKTFKRKYYLSPQEILHYINQYNL